MNGTQKLCILTVHGIGFQQPPTASAAGYADLLHENLREALNLFHPAISRAWRTWMALASCPARQGQQRSLRRMRQVLSWALARSPGLRSWAWARLASFWEEGLFRPRYGIRTSSPAPW